MRIIEIARRMAQLGETGEALRAYAVVLHAGGEPEELLEAAAYTLQNGGDYQIAYTAFVELHRAGKFRDETFGVLTQAFYEPNVRDLEGRYERNRKLLARYPYLFRKDFPAFGDLPVKFYPYDDGGYVPFDARTGEFRDFVNVKEPVVGRNFFHDLEKPILASGVYSQYELEYLNDNVRPSEWCARENHVYLHYADWAEFCSWLQVLNLRPLTESKKAVFLMGDELSQYPIDFKARFGIDYSRNKPRPIGLREVNRLIWHTQFSSHNGGDFFNEILDAHPNLLFYPSVMLYKIEKLLGDLRGQLEELRAYAGAPAFEESAVGRTFEKLYHLKDVTDKDLLVALYMASDSYDNEGDPTARIAPALFFQPHFHNVEYRLEANERGDAVLDCDEAEQIGGCEWLKAFKYIKTFTPLRRPTTSHGGTVRLMARMSELQWVPKYQYEGPAIIVPDAVTERVLNRSYLRDPDDRLYRDAVIVRFEDGKLNPEATFTRLAAFLDLPYTESMTYCSDMGERKQARYEGEVLGFDSASVYRTYDEYMNDDERRYIEFFLRDLYAYYGYGFQAYDGAPTDPERVKAWIGGFDTINGYMRESWRKVYDKGIDKAVNKTPGERIEGMDEKIRGKLKTMTREALMEELLDELIQKADGNRVRVAEVMLKGLRFVNRRGQPLQITPLLEPDPALLKQPLYR